MRTILELEVVSVCWDALDGSTIYDLLNSSLVLSVNVTMALHVLLAFWYLSVGFRTALMFWTHLPPDDPLYKMITMQPLTLSQVPTVDRTLQSIRLYIKCIK